MLANISHSPGTSADVPWLKANLHLKHVFFHLTIQYCNFFLRLQGLLFPSHREAIGSKPVPKKE